jgi:hypothetical protein
MMVAIAKVKTIPKKNISVLITSMSIIFSALGDNNNLDNKLGSAIARLPSKVNWGS